MQPFEFLPRFPLLQSDLVVTGLILLAGVLCGELFRRVLQLPRITGYLLAGLVLGPGTLGLLDRETLNGARLLIDIALGLILFELGSRLDFGWLKRNPWLLATSVAESALTFGLIYFVLTRFGVLPQHAAIAAAIGIGTSPSVLLMVVHDQRADGPLSEQAVNLTALNNAFSVIAVTMLLTNLHMQYQLGWYLVVLHPAYLLAGSFVLGVVMGALTLLVASWLGKREDLQFVMLVAIILATVGCAVALKLSVLLSLLSLGVMVRNRDRHHRMLPVEFGPAAQFFFVALFVLTGAYLDVKMLLAGTGITFAYIGARFAGKLLGITVFAPISGLRLRKAALLGIALSPIAAVAVVLVQVVASVYPEAGVQVGNIVLSAVLILGLIGPALTQIALRLSGETRASTASSGG